MVGCKPVYGVCSSLVILSIVCKGFYMLCFNILIVFVVLICL